MVITLYHFLIIRQILSIWYVWKQAETQACKTVIYKITNEVSKWLWISMDCEWEIYSI